MTYSESRKSLLLILFIVGGLLCLHLVFVYIYSDGIKKGEIGGSIKIGIVGEAPTIPNPLEYDLNSQYKDAILRFLFRSLVRYNPTTESYEGDIANCDIRTLSRVTCTLKEGIVWSDGSPIKVDDVGATYSALKERNAILPTYESLATNSNVQKTESFLKNLKITASGNTLEFVSNENSTSMIDILLYPIIRSDMIDRIKTGRFSSENYITSGNYRFMSRDSDDQYGFDRITLERNASSSGVFIDTYQFRFYRDMAGVRKNEDALSIIIPNRMIDLAPSSPRFIRHMYRTYEYVSLFANTDRLGGDIRSILLSGIGVSPLTESLSQVYTPIQNIFFTGSSMVPPVGTGTITNALQKIGYYRVDALLHTLESQPILFTGTITDFGKNTYFTTPVAPYFFTAGNETEMRLEGNVGSGVTGVMINDYTLREFKVGEKKFVYRVSVDAGTLRQGTNTYILRFLYSDGRSEEKETITVYHYADKDAENTLRRELNTKLLAAYNSSENQAKREANIMKEKNKILALDPQYHYNRAGEVYALSLMYLDTPDIATIAEEVQKRAMGMGVKINLSPLDSKAIATMMKEGKENYDMLIVGFEAPNRISNINPVFSSTSVNSGINFSNIEDKKLDELLQKLRTTVNQSEQVQVQKDITERIRNNAIMIPLYTVNRYFYYDKNILDTSFTSVFPSFTILPDTLKDSYIKSSFSLNFQNKSFIGFFRWIISQF